MKAITAPYGLTGQWFPALQDSKGQLRTADWTTFDRDAAYDYAALAARLNPHDDLNAIRWPKRADEMAKEL